MNPLSTRQLYRASDFARRADLLPVDYYHVVFTLPAPVSVIANSRPIALNEQGVTFQWKGNRAKGKTMALGTCAFVSAVMVLIK